MPRLEKAVAAALRALGITVGVCVVAACQGSTTPIPYTPITGIVIRSSALVAGYGCGTDVDQVYRYVAVVSYAPIADGGRDAQGAPSGGPWVNISECFSDTVFENLPPAMTTGSQAFTIEIFAYDKQAYDEAQLPADLSCSPDSGGATCNGGSDAVNPDPQQKALASWTTSCSATQAQGAPVLAMCPPLTMPESGGAEASTPIDATAEGAASDAAPSEAMTTEAGARDAAVGD